MQTLLNDIELDIQELKCLLQAVTSDTNPALRVVAKRSIQQMKTRLDELQKLLDKNPAADCVVVHAIEPIPTEQHPANSPSSILAESIKPATELRKTISLNDSFRFAREIFHGDSSRMNDVVHRLNEASTLDKAIELFNLEVEPDENNEATADFIELLKKHFS